MAITSKEINLAQLDKELGSKGLVANFTDPASKIILPAEGNDISENELKEAIENHIALFEQPTIEQKLASVGLNLDDLKTALGL